jgi:hypothetical protein
VGADKEAYSIRRYHHSLTTRALTKMPGFPRKRRARGTSGYSGNSGCRAGSRSSVAPCVDVTVMSSILRRSAVNATTSRW